ncbi:MAG: serine hydrolase, partial [Bacteroidota bacterium]
MIFKLSTAVVILSLLFTFSLLSQQLSEAEFSELSQQVEEYAQDYPGVSISVAQEQEIIWNYTTGYADLATKKAVERNTRFNIYSTSKFITGLAYLK